MNEINFNNKKFVFLENSESGQVDSETIFKYKQEGKLVTADYFGGSIIYGKIIDQPTGNQLDMLYQCLTTDDHLKQEKRLQLFLLLTMGN